MPWGSRYRSEDEIIWKGEEIGWFSLKSAMQTSSPPTIQLNWKPILWFEGQIPKHSACAWLAISRGLKTRDLLCFKNIACPAQCALSNHTVESISHFFLSCPFRQEIWNSITTRLKAAYSRCSSIVEDINTFLNYCNQSNWTTLLCSSCVTVLISGRSGGIETSESSERQIASSNKFFGRSWTISKWGLATLAWTFRMFFLQHGTFRLILGEELSLSGAWTPRPTRTWSFQ